MGDSPGAVNDEIGLDHSPVAGGLDGHPVAGAAWVDRRDCRVSQRLDADIGPACDQQLDEVGVETFEGLCATVDDHRGGPGPGGDVGELERHEPPADEEHPAGQVFKVEEGGAIDSQERNGTSGALICLTSWCVRSPSSRRTTTLKTRRTVQVER